jgi:hypothetical protein
MGAAEQPSAKEEVMDTITRVGVDLAKNVIQIHAVDSAERVVTPSAPGHYTGYPAGSRSSRWGASVTGWFQRCAHAV